MLAEAIKNKEVIIELVPPHNYRHNPTECAIHTFKNRILPGLATCHPHFLIREWNRLLQQAELTLNYLKFIIMGVIVWEI